MPEGRKGQSEKQKRSEFVSTFSNSQMKKTEFRVKDCKAVPEAAAVSKTAKVAAGFSFGEVRRFGFRPGRSIT